MEDEILELIDGDHIAEDIAREIIEEKKKADNRLIEANIKLVDKNKYLIEDLKILSKFINSNFNVSTLNENLKRIINYYLEEK